VRVMLKMMRTKRKEGKGKAMRKRNEKKKK